MKLSGQAKNKYKDVNNFNKCNQDHWENKGNNSVCNEK